MERRELSESQKKAIREWREKYCFPICDRPMWYESLPERKKRELRKWRKACLDATKTGVCPPPPAWVK